MSDRMAMWIVIAGLALSNIVNVVQWHKQLEINQNLSRLLRQDENEQKIKGLEETLYYTREALGKMSDVYKNAKDYNADLKRFGSAQVGPQGSKP